MGLLQDIENRDAVIGSPEYMEKKNSIIARYMVTLSKMIMEYKYPIAVIKREIVDNWNSNTKCVNLWSCTERYKYLVDLPGVKSGFCSECSELDPVRKDSPLHFRTEFDSMFRKLCKEHVISEIKKEGFEVLTYDEDNLIVYAPEFKDKAEELYRSITIQRKPSLLKRFLSAIGVSVIISDRDYSRI